MDKQHMIYKITNKINGRFYIGMHTGFPDDAYFGSGKRIKAEIKKYGKDNFKKEILEYCISRETLVFREIEIVNSELLKNALCLNLKLGGEGGWVTTKEMVTKRSKTFRDKKLKFIRTEEIKKKISKSKLGNLNFKNSSRFEGHKCSEEHKMRIGMKNSFHMQGEKNSQFGTCWVIKDVKPIKIKKEQLDEYLANGYSRGRKILE